MMRVVLMIAAAFTLTGCNPKNEVASLFWPESPAPWETVDAYYYPDADRMWELERLEGFATVSACKVWAWDQAMVRGDTMMKRGAYECGFGAYGYLGLKPIYRVVTQ